VACDAAIHAGGKAMELGPALLAVGEGEWPDHFEPFAAALDPAWIQPALSAADTQRWRGLAVDGVDGSTLRIADTPENESVFGRPGSSRGAAAYPQLRLVTRMALRAHLLAGLALGPHTTGEVTLAETLQVRAVRYQRRGFITQTLLTSLTDSERYPASEIAALYHERWELELAFDELKTHTLEREETLRSRTPARVYQEVWGLAIGYNLVRLAMARAARVLSKS